MIRGIALESRSDEPGTEPEAAEGDAGRRGATERLPERSPTSIWKKLLLAVTTLALVLFVLETGARLLMPGRAPVLKRDSYYENPLPLITGPISTDYIPEGERLREDKEPNELRVFVFGESSVWGSPLDPYAAMPAMLYDQLQEALPDRKVTVVSMGRPGSVSANIYYYLLFARRFEPDFNVFYMGSNDGPKMPGEQCMLATRPSLHALWRALVSRSWLLWSVRSLLPTFLWRLSSQKVVDEDWDCATPSFHDWTKLLVRVSLDMGAKVVVATPVRNAAWEFELKPNVADPAGTISLDDKPPGYRELLRCELDPACDYELALKKAQQERGFVGPSPDVTLEELRRQLHHTGRASSFHIFEVDYKALAWQRATGQPDVELIPFHRHLEQVSPHGVLSAYFADQMRLLPRGYYFLANHIAERILATLQGRAPAPVPPPEEADVARYIAETRASGTRNAEEQILFGEYLTSVPGLRFAVESFPPGTCEERKLCGKIEWSALTLGWLRLQVGLPHGLSPELAELLDGFSPLTHTYDDTRGNVPRVR